jgi:hypothetical protein
MDNDGLVKIANAMVSKGKGILASADRLVRIKKRPRPDHERQRNQAGLVYVVAMRLKRCKEIRGFSTQGILNWKLPSGIVVGSKICPAALGNYLRNDGPRDGYRLRLVCEALGVTSEIVIKDYDRWFRKRGLEWPTDQNDMATAEQLDEYNAKATALLAAISSSDGSNLRASE